ncbi:hypothetical protein ACFQ36_11755 [Arthrobacter sp. GCM10027362]|uniref:hypothetical protein n=1 Tax=Arthrobacter sp. GCM10027362 TaxID=3273379 RepID=UPI00362EDF17
MTLPSVDENGRSTFLRDWVAIATVPFYLPWLFYLFFGIFVEGELKFPYPSNEALMCYALALAFAFLQNPKVDAWIRPGGKHPVIGSVISHLKLIVIIISLCGLAVLYTYELGALKNDFVDPEKFDLALRTVGVCAALPALIGSFFVVFSRPVNESW